MRGARPEPLHSFFYIDPHLAADHNTEQRDTLVPTARHARSIVDIRN